MYIMTGSNVYVTTWWYIKWSPKTKLMQFSSLAASVKLSTKAHISTFTWWILNTVTISALKNGVHSVFHILYNETIWANSQGFPWCCCSWEKMLSLGWPCSRPLWGWQKEVNINCWHLWPPPGSMGGAPHNRRATSWTVPWSMHLTAGFSVLVWWVGWQLLLQFPSQTGYHNSRVERATPYKSGQ